ncbi:MAG: helix-turn-helix transcriptional regulator [Phycisphaerae bacterium]|nr:helix-turn-helix transcriptional regulator [Phycisphaerae bacterium]
MPNVLQALKAEIGRVAKRELKKDIARLRQDTIWLKKNIADFKRRVAALERENRLLRAKSSRLEKGTTPPAEDLQKMRVTGKMVRALRKRLKISQVELGKLLNVSGQSVYQWERKDGRLRLRELTKAALQRVRQMGKREVKAEMDKLG